MSADERDDLDDLADLDDVPLQHKKPFGSGLRRNEIKFVPASNEDPEVAKQQKTKSNGQSISDFYLNMVLKKPASTAATTDKETAKAPVCEICSMPVSGAADDNTGSGTTTASSSSNNRRLAGPHEASIAHQVCLAHSHPPSALDRSRMGLTGQGTQYPVKVKPKEDRLGVGVVVPKGGGGPAKKQREGPKLLDAKKVRKMAAEDRKRADKLQRELFGRVDLDKYLGPGA
ncbi:hypothetical protein KVR01_002721 [Diaporthe batatas]|uniref:uncharacterized protein n=1 Tax=Diaporthe batatas TaxID=748121 RepID=UPI001D05768D|nr:uncharacterized protein KVR01_002721 [Diaporthe batatas]KAG8167032.1 hypothetical protein KVR01_002721 [Diaporthe batatas]